jgi:hypothetical protein
MCFCRTHRSDATLSDHRGLRMLVRARYITNLRASHQTSNPIQAPESHFQRPQVFKITDSLSALAPTTPPWDNKPFFHAFVDVVLFGRRRVKIACWSVCLYDVPLDPDVQAHAPFARARGLVVSDPKRDFYLGAQNLSSNIAHRAAMVELWSFFYTFGLSMRIRAFSADSY